MNGVSYMVPFVVTGGLLIAISLTLGGTATPEGIDTRRNDLGNDE